MDSNLKLMGFRIQIWAYRALFLRAAIWSREGKNQEEFIESEMDLLCEPEVSGLLVNLPLWVG